MKKQIVRKALHLIESKFDAIRLKKSDGRLLQFYNLIQASKNNDWTEEERNALSRVQELHSYYAESESNIQIKDHGFGQSSDTRTNEQMLEGVELTKKVSDVYKSASSSKKNGELMFRIIRAYKPNLCFELGTCLGISAAYGLQALNLNKKGKFISLEGATELANMAQESLERFEIKGLEIITGRFQDTLPNLLKEHKDIDFAFIDGHHEEKATLDYFEMFFDNISEKGILIFDDINWSSGMRKAWRRLKNDSRINCTIDTYDRGICFINKSKTSKSNYKVWF
ncbi:O-methyltransferase [Roseivirga echinicomitans]